jgi:division protein CdvB (Snf7/Vps24/ESCRT-III family)
MAVVEENINRVNQKLQQLLKQYFFLQKENEKLRLSVTNLQTAREQDVETIYRLQQQVSILKSSIGQMKEPDKKIFEKQINQYIKEIDKCIGLLSE